MKNGNDHSRHKRILAYLKFALLLIFLIGVPVFLYLKFGADVFSKDSAGRLLSYLRANKKTAFLLIIAIQAIQVIICILPGQPIQFASSYMFGILPGFLLSIVGAVIGTAVSFYLSKILGRDMINILFDKDKVDDYHRKLNSGRGLSLVMLIYLIPGVPKDLVSYVAGISDMKFRPFILVSTVARSPGMIGSLLLGHFFGRQNYMAISVTSVIVAVLVIIFILKRNSIIEMLDRLEKSE